MTARYACPSVYGAYPKIAPLCLGVLVWLLLPVGPASGGFPGANGKIAFESNGGRIWVMNPDGSGQTMLPGISDHTPAWSPDGQRIAFRRDSDGNGEIYVMNADGSGATRLTNNFANDYEPAWSPDASKIVFRSERDGPLGAIYVMNTDGTGQTRITFTPGAADSEPVWSPNGTRIAFTSYSLSAGSADIYVMNPDGSGKTALTSSPSGTSAVEPDWSPGGSKIAFRATWTGNSDIYLMNADGSGKTPLTTNPSLDAWPAWSPDGTKIVFASDRAGPIDIYVMNADGTDQTRLTKSQQLNEVKFYPDWQPIRAKADVSLTKNDAPDPVTVGDALTYTLTTHDAGPNEAAGVNIVDTLPAGVTFVSASASQGSCSQAAGLVTCNLGSLASGADAKVTIVVKPSGPGTITNTASVGSPTSDPNMANNSASATTTVAPRNRPPDCSRLLAWPGLLWPPDHKWSLVKVGGATDPDGDNVIYTITGVTQDEPLNGLGDGDTWPDAAAGLTPGSVYLRAERSVLGDGRIYRIAITASDGKGGTCSGRAFVGVPHDMGIGATPIDTTGVSVNSFR